MNLKNFIILLITGIATTGVVLGCGEALSQKTSSTVEYRRSGGIAGFQDHLVIERNGDAHLIRKARTQDFALSSETMQQIEETFADAHFASLDKKYLASSDIPDALNYSITYNNHTVRTIDTAIPAQLVPVIELLDTIIVKQGNP